MKGFAVYFVCNAKEKPDGSTEYFPHGIIDFQDDVLIAKGIAVELCEDFFGGRIKKVSYVIPTEPVKIIQTLRYLFENEYFRIIEREDVSRGFMHKPNFPNNIRAVAFNFKTMQQVNTRE